MREAYEAIIQSVLEENVLVVQENFATVMKAKCAAVVEDYKTAVSQDMFNVFPFDFSGKPKADDEDESTDEDNSDDADVSDDDETDDTEHPELDETDPEDTDA